jgi:rhamnose transport system ATP-binding protein
LRSINKSYGETRALRDVSIDFNPGSAHALVGENGAGKSTLGKVLCGIVKMDSGEITLRNQSLQFGSPAQALKAGFSMIAQELALVPERTAAENIFLGMQPTRGPFLSRRTLRTELEDLFERTGIEVPTSLPVNQMKAGDQQKVEILRALARNSEILVMDEPTARLSRDETEALKRVTSRLIQDGKTVIFVSHFLDEVLEMCDHVTIMRDGAVVRTGTTVNESRESLIEAMTGRRVDADFPQSSGPDREAGTLFECSQLHVKDGPQDISMTIRRGEIVALTGLVGAGRTELGQAILGARPVTSGRMKLNGVDYRPKSPHQAAKHGVYLVPESRKEQGLFEDLTISYNLTVPHPKLLERFLLVWSRLRAAVAQQAIHRFGVKAQSVDAPVTSLSGGNQQKVVIARALLEKPLLLVADEPTRGVDVGAKRAIYELICSEADRGLGILLISSELEEVLGLAHRVLVVSDGRLVAELPKGEVTRAKVLSAMFETKRSIGD